MHGIKIGLRVSVCEALFFGLLGLVAAKGLSAQVQANPPFGRAGTVVRVTLGGKLPAQRVVFNGSDIKFFGDESMVWFTVPIRAEGVGTNESMPVDVIVFSAAGEIGREKFNWLVGPPQKLSVADLVYDIRYAKDAAGKYLDYMQLMLNGAGFNTDCVVKIDGVVDSQIVTTLPAIRFSFPGVDNFGRAFPKFELGRQGTAIVAVFAKKVAPLGLRSVRVVCGDQQVETKVNLPGRFVRVEIDSTYDSEWQVTEEEQEKALAAFAQAGILLDLRFNPKRDSPCNRDLCGDVNIAVRDASKPCCVSENGIIDFLAATDHQAQADLFDGQWFVHLAIMPRFYDDKPMLAVYGMLIDEPSRQKSVMFLDPLGESDKLRTFLHEIGHALNLTHCENDPTAMLSLMVPSYALNGDHPQFAFSESAIRHLAEHRPEEVQPGVGGQAFNTDQRSEKRCSDASGKDGVDVVADLTVAAPAKVVGVGKPVILRVKLEGKGGLPAGMSLAPEFGEVEYKIAKIQPENQDYQIFHPLEYFDVKHDGENVQGPVQEWVDMSFGNQGLYFSKAGTYEVIARYKGHESAPSRLLIEDDPRCSKEDVAAFLDEKNALFIHLKGAVSLEESSLLTLEKVGNHSLCGLAAVANEGLGNYYFSQGSDEKALSFLEKSYANIGELPDVSRFSLYEKLIKGAAVIAPQRASKYLNELDAIVKDDERAKDYEVRAKDFLLDPLIEKPVDLLPPKSHFNPTCEVDIIEPLRPQVTIRGRKSIVDLIGSVDLQPISDPSPARAEDEWKPTLRVQEGPGFSAKRKTVELSLRPKSQIRTINVTPKLDLRGRSVILPPGFEAQATLRVEGPCDWPEEEFERRVSLVLDPSFQHLLSPGETGVIDLQVARKQGAAFKILSQKIAPGSVQATRSVQ